MEPSSRPSSSLASSCALLPVWYQLTAILALSLLFFFTNESEVIQWVASQFHVDFGTSALWSTGTDVSQNGNDASAAAAAANSALLRSASKDWKNYHNFMEVMSLRERLALVVYSVLLVLLIYVVSPLRLGASSQHCWLLPTWLVNKAEKRLKRRAFSLLFPVVPSQTATDSIDTLSSSSDDDDLDEEDRERTASRHSKFSTFVLGIVLAESIVLLRSWILQATCTNAYRDVALAEGALLTNAGTSMDAADATAPFPQSQAAFLSNIVKLIDFQRLHPAQWLAALSWSDMIPLLQSTGRYLDANIHFIVQREVFRQMTHWWVLHVLPATVCAFFHRLLLDTRQGIVVSFRWCFLTYGWYRIVIELFSALFVGNWWSTSADHLASSTPGKSAAASLQQKGGWSVLSWIDSPWAPKMFLLLWCALLLAYSNFLYGPRKRQGMIAIPSVKLRFVLTWTMLARCAVAPIIVFLVVLTISLSVHIVELALLWLVLLLLLLWIPASVDTFSTDFFLLFGALISISFSDTPLLTVMNSWSSLVKLLTCFVVVVGTFATVSLVFNSIRMACRSRMIALVVLAVVAGLEIIVARYLPLALQLEHVQWLFSFVDSSTDFTKNADNYILWGLWTFACATHAVLAVACHTVFSTAPSASVDDGDEGQPMELSLTFDSLLTRWISSCILATSTAISIASALLFYQFVMKQLALPVDIGRLLSLFVACAVFGAVTESAEAQLEVVCRILGLKDPPARTEWEE